MHYGPQHRILLNTKGLSEEFCYAQWTIGHDLVMRQTNYNSAEPHQIFLKACNILKRDSEARKETYIISSTLGLCHPCSKSLVSLKEIWFLYIGPRHRMSFKLNYSTNLKQNSKKNLVLENNGRMDQLMMKARVRKSHDTVPLKVLSSKN